MSKRELKKLGNKLKFYLKMHDTTLEKIWENAENDKCLKCRERREALGLADPQSCPKLALFCNAGDETCTVEIIEWNLFSILGKCCVEWVKYV